MKFHWNIVRGWTVESLANGHILVKPDYIPQPYEEGCSPVGVFTRMRLALWIYDRLVKRKANAKTVAPAIAPR